MEATYKSVLVCGVVEPSPLGYLYDKPHFQTTRLDIHIKAQTNLLRKIMFPVKWLYRDGTKTSLSFANIS